MAVTVDTSNTLGAMDKDPFTLNAISSTTLFICCIIIAFISLVGCKPKESLSSLFSLQDSIRIVAEILHHRAEADSAFLYDPASPFKQDATVRFEGLKWFPPTLEFYCTSKLYRYPAPETVIVYGTKGEERKQLKYGYFLISYKGKSYRLNTYKSMPEESERNEQYRHYLSVWFTDVTTGKETYGVGRYIDVGDEQPDTSYRYTIDFNKAYNPYCAYNSQYSCAIPRKEDHLDFPIRAGELPYHDELHK